MSRRWLCLVGALPLLLRFAVPALANGMAHEHFSRIIATVKREPRYSLRLTAALKGAGFGSRPDVERRVFIEIAEDHREPQRFRRKVSFRFPVGRSRLEVVYVREAAQAYLMISPPGRETTAYRARAKGPTGNLVEAILRRAGPAGAVALTRPNRLELREKHPGRFVGKLVFDLETHRPLAFWGTNFWRGINVLVGFSRWRFGKDVDVSLPLPVERYLEFDVSTTGAAAGGFASALRPPGAAPGGESTAVQETVEAMARLLGATEVQSKQQSTTSTSPGAPVAR